MWIRVCVCVRARPAVTCSRANGAFVWGSSSQGASERTLYIGMESHRQKEQKKPPTSRREIPSRGVLCVVPAPRRGPTHSHWEPRADEQRRQQRRHKANTPANGALDYGGCERGADECAARYALAPGSKQSVALSWTNWIRIRSESTVQGGEPPPARLLLVAATPPRRAPGPQLATLESRSSASEWILGGARTRARAACVTGLQCRVSMARLSAGVVRCCCFANGVAHFLHETPSPRLLTVSRLATDD